MFSGRNYGQSLVMTDQISNLTQQSFPDFHRNDQSLNETILALKCDKMHVLDMKRKSLLNIISHATKFFPLILLS